MKPANEIFARHLLATRKQQSNETLDEFLQSLKILSRDCNFKNVDAVIYHDECVYMIHLYPGLLQTLLDNVYLKIHQLSYK